MLFNKRDAAFSERISVLLWSLQRDASAMAALRSRLESKLKHAESPIPADGSQVSALLELVKAGEDALGELASASESSQYLGEFMRIITSAADSLSAVRCDMEKVIPAAEKALEEIMAVITNCNLPQESGQEPRQIMAEAADASGSIAMSEPKNGAATQSHEEPRELAA